MKVPFFSVIIPVYNVEQYLERCIDSVINQNFQDYEIVLVNDGSTDSSLDICKRYATDTKVVLVNKPNGGLSSARNCGMDNSSGMYLLFLDSDDYFASGCLQQLYNIITKFTSDVFCIKARTIFDDGDYYDEHNSLPVKEYSSGEYLRCIGKEILYSACSPYMVYKRSFIEENNFRFYLGILHEDELWTPQVLLKANSICWTNILVYYHCLRKGSITQSSNYRKRGTSLVTVLDQLLQDEQFVSNPNAAAIRNQWAFLFLEAVVFLNASDEIVKHFDKFDAYRFASTKKMRQKALLYAISPKLYVKVRNLVKK